MMKLVSDLGLSHGIGHDPFRASLSTRSPLLPPSRPTPL